MAGQVVRIPLSILTIIYTNIDRWDEIDRRENGWRYYWKPESETCRPRKPDPPSDAKFPEQTWYERVVLDNKRLERERKKRKGFRGFLSKLWSKP